jgi:mRNA interferase MazF
MKRFDVVLVQFPYSNLSKSKKRPAVILACVQPHHLPMHCIISMITSKMKGLQFPFDVTLKEYELAGLPKPSLVRISKVVAIDSEIIVKRMGSLTHIDQLAVKKAFSKMMKS